MKKLLFASFLFIGFNAASQQCKIKFVIKDMQSNTPLAEATIEENNKDIGITGNDGILITKTRDANLYTFTIKKPGYEVWQDYVVNGIPDTTETSPIYLSSLNYLTAQLYIEADKFGADATKVNELFIKINKSYEKFGDEKNKKEFSKKFQTYCEEKKIKATTIEGKIIDLSKPETQNKLNKLQQKSIIQQKFN